MNDCERLRIGCGIIGEAIELMCRDNPALLELYEPFASIYSRQMERATVKRDRATAHETLMFADVEDAFAVAFF